MNFNELSDLFLMQCAMGDVSPPSSDARMAAALMPTWSVMKLSTVLMDPMRCIVNNVSTLNSGLENLLSADSMLFCAFCSYLLTLLCLFPWYYICRFCHLPDLCWLQELIFLLGCFLPLKYSLALFSVPDCKTSEPVLPSPSNVFLTEWHYLLGDEKWNHNFS